MKSVKQYLCFEVLVRKSVLILVDPLSQLNNSRILATNTTVKTATTQTRVTTKTTSGTRKVVLATMERTVTKAKPAAAKATTERSATTKRSATKAARSGSPNLKPKIIIVLVLTSIVIVISPTLVGYHVRKDKTLVSISISSEWKQQTFFLLMQNEKQSVNNYHPTSF